MTRKQPDYVFSLLFLILASELLVYFTNTFILTSDFYKSSGQVFSTGSETEEYILATLQKWIYISTAIYQIIRVLIIAMIIYTALFMYEISVSYRSLLGVVARADLIFFIPAICKVIYFSGTTAVASLSEWHRFYFLSALWYIGDVSPDWQYALQTINVYEFAYWFLLAYGLARLVDRPFDFILKIVVRSYVPALIIWVMLVTFMLILYFPQMS